MTYKTFILIIAMASLAACGGGSTSEPIQVPVALVKTIPAALGDLPITLSGFGSIEFDPAGQRTLNAEIEARILELNAQPGDIVDKDAIILKLKPSSAAGVDMTRTRRDANAASAVAARTRRLREDGLASDAEVEAAETAARDLLEQATSLEARADSVLSLRAPMAGVIDAIFVASGDLIPSGTPLVRLASPGALQARVGLEIEDVARMKVGDQVRLYTLDDSNQVLNTIVRSIDRRVDPSTRMATALIAIPAGRELLSGEAVRTEIIVQIKKDVLIVPRQAIFLDETGPYVFINTAGTATLKRVSSGDTNGNHTEIESGLAAGDPVVVEGGAILSDGMKVRTAKVSTAITP